MPAQNLPNATTPTNVDTAIPEVWAPDTLRKFKVQGYWSKWIGNEGSGAPIIQKTELLNKPGDLIHVQVTNPLSGAGIEGDTTVLLGNEETLSTSEIKGATILYRHAVGINRRANKKAIVDLRSEARMRLDEWLMNKRDNLYFTLFTGLTSAVLPASLVGETYVPNQFSFDSAAASGLDSTTPHIDDVDSDDVVSVKGLQALRLKLRLQQARPLSAGGTPFYVFLTHPNSTFDLKQEARYESWVRDAERRGGDNPFFQGALAMIDGVLLHDHENVPTATNATSVKVSKGLIFGSEAFIEVLDEGVSFNEEITDYGMLYGLAISVAFSARRALELSSAQVYARASDV